MGGAANLNNGTILWENPNPNASFVSTTVQLLDDIDNYKYISIKYYLDNERHPSNPMEIIYSIFNFKRLTGGNSNVYYGILGAVTLANRYRRFLYKEPGKITFGNGVGINDTVYSGACIPYQVIGYK